MPAPAEPLAYDRTRPDLFASDLAGKGIDLLTIDTIRTLAIDAVQKANSGHAGAPMAMAPIGYTLWSRFLRYDPERPHWPNRDRFVLSAGHGSMLLYSLLHLAGVKACDRDGKPLNQPAVSLEDIENFRQLGGVTAGHPEYGLATGVETTTGPLGQGAANSVGMAMAERWLAARYNTPDAKLFDYNVYALCSDGDLMEGVASEAASLAGHLQPLQPVLDLGRQHRDHRGSHRPRLQRGRAERFRGLRLGDPAWSTTPTTARPSPGRSRASRPRTTGRP